MVFVYLLVVAFILFVSPFLFAFIYVLRHYYRRVEIRGETPEEYELEFESLSYTSLDGIPLKAWWVKPDYLLSNETASGVIILIHGLLGMDASSMLGHAKFLQGK